MSVDLNVLKLVQKEVIHEIQISQYDFPIKAIGVNFTKPNDLKWFELVFLDFDQPDYWGDERTIAAQINIILYFPAGNGIYDQLETMGYFAGRFNKGRNFYGLDRRVTISQNPRIGATSRGKYIDGEGFQVADNGVQTATVLSLSLSSFIA